MDVALCKLKTNNTPKTYLASRTDKGVHALKSAMTIDLDLIDESEPISILSFLNHYLDKNKFPIRVNDVLSVTPNFNCRKAPLYRQYVYRFAILKANCLPECRTTKNTLPIPVSEQDRCFFVTDSNFNYELVKIATEIFVGQQDYITFLGKPGSNIHDENLLTARCLHRCDIEPVGPYIPSPLDNFYNYYHLTCQGRSFIYNQVRNMVAILLAVGQGKLSLDYVQQMFLDPTPNSWPSDLEKAPAHGLYLTDVCYNPKYSEKDQSEILHKSSQILEKRKNELKKRLQAMQLRKTNSSSC